jgi:hypothetical protein
MRFRKLRIAWSVFWGLLIVLLIELWVQSYWKPVVVCFGGFPLSKTTRVWRWNRGHIESFRTWSAVPDMEGQWLWTTPLQFEHFNDVTPKYSFPGVRYFEVPIPNVFISNWIPTLVLATVATIPWAPWWSKRFSIRTLLIATTLVAVVLGLIVWLIR